MQDRVKLYTKSLNSRLALNFARLQTASEVSDNLMAEYSVGSMSYSCSYCDAKFWESEKLLASTKSCLKFSLCCGQSKVVLPPLATPTDLLLHLLTATDSKYVINQIPGEGKTLLSADSMPDDQAALYPTEFLN